MSRSLPASYPHRRDGGARRTPARPASRGALLPARLRNQLAVCARRPERVLFLDIETTGLSHHYDDITVIGWSFDGRAQTVIGGQDIRALREDAARAEALVTFNGIRFDTKFIGRRYPDLRLPKVHVDLMYLCRRVGLTGGQKAIEKTLNLDFRDGLEEVDGAAAVVLWHRYVRACEEIGKPC